MLNNERNKLKSFSKKNFLNFNYVFHMDTILIYELKKEL